MAPPDQNSRSAGLKRLRDVPLTVTVELGNAVMLIQDVLQLGPGSVVELDRMHGEPVDIKINGKLLARGEVVVVNDKMAVRITEMVGSVMDEAG